MVYHGNYRGDDGIHVNAESYHAPDEINVFKKADANLCLNLLQTYFLNFIIFRTQKQKNEEPNLIHFKTW